MKEKGGTHCSLAAGKRNMNSFFCSPAYLVKTFLSFFFIPFALFFLSHILKDVFCGLSVAAIPAQSIVDPPTGRLSHCFLRI